MRVCSALLIDGVGRAVKTRKFSNPIYLGDPLNIAKIWSDYCVDEVVFIDYLASVQNRPHNFDLLSRVRQLMDTPITSGGGLKSLADITKCLDSGADRVLLGSSSLSPGNDFLVKASRHFGASTIVVSLDFRLDDSGSAVLHSENGRRSLDRSVMEAVRWLDNSRLVGEIILHDIEGDGLGNGYEIHNLLIEDFARAGFQNTRVLLMGGGYDSMLEEEFSYQANSEVFAGVVSGRAFALKACTSQVLINKIDGELESVSKGIG